MSNADYEAVASGNFCPIATLGFSVEHLTSTFSLTDLRRVLPDDVYVGMPALIDNEIVRVESFTDSSMVVKRGCADTIPAPHISGAIIFFMGVGFTSTDRREYLGNETVSLKSLPRTSSGTTPIEYSPPVEVIFNQRFARPYPPGQMLVNDLVWTSVVTMSRVVDLILSWVGRNRVVQADQLVGWSEAGIASEVGTTYRIVLSTAGDTVVRTITGLTGLSWPYTFEDAVEDFALEALVDTGDYAAHLTIESMRDGLASWQKYRVDFVVDTDQIVPPDASIANVSLLLHGDNANGSSVVTDSGPLNLSPSTVSNVTNVAAAAKFDQGALVSSSTAAVLEYTSNIAFRMVQLFTIEFELFQAANQNCDFMGSTATRCFNLAGTTLTSKWGGATLSCTIVNSQYNHIRVTRDASNNVRLFLNGTQVATAVASTVETAAAVFGVFNIPARADLPSFVGRLDEVRFTDGVCRSVADFSAPVKPHSNA